MHTFILFNNIRWGVTIMTFVVKRRCLGTKKVLDSQLTTGLLMQLETSCKLSASQSLSFLLYEVKLIIVLPL